LFEQEYDFNVYGWKWENKPSESASHRGYYAKYLNVNSYHIRLYPFYFLYGGYTKGVLHNVGDQSNYWSSSVVSDSAAYYFDFYVVDSYPSDQIGKTFGFSIRCLAR